LLLDVFDRNFLQGSASFRPSVNPTLNAQRSSRVPVRLLP
jgi:hypothetical protein